MKQEITINVSPEDLDTLYYALAQAEMMWRQRSHNPDIDNVGSGADPEVFEAECRDEMKRYRQCQKRFAALMPKEWYNCEGPWALDED